MYPISLGFPEARKRILALIENGHHAEALLTTIFTAEKTIRRTLKALIVLRGFTNKQADTLLENRGMENLKTLWPVFDPASHSLSLRVGEARWGVIQSAVKMRNKIVHGARVYPLEECRQVAEAALEALEAVRACFDDSFGYDGWGAMPVRRTSKVPWFGRSPRPDDQNPV